MNRVADGDMGSLGPMMKLLTHSGILHNRKWIAQVVYLEVDIGQTIALLDQASLTQQVEKKGDFYYGDRWHEPCIDLSSAAGRRTERGLAYEDVTDATPDSRLLSRSRCAWRRDVGRICRH